MRRGHVMAIGLSIWIVVGAAVAGLLGLAMHVTDAFAISGLGLTFAAVGLTLGPFKTPMVWSEGGLVTYQGNANRSDGPRSKRLRLLAIPACAFGAGVVLLITSGALAAAGM